MKLQKLALPIHDSFQFLYSLGFSLKNKIMFLGRQTYEILRAVVILNPVKVMNYPAFRQRLVVSLFPNKDMFTDIAIDCSRMVGHSNMCISMRVYYTTTNPIMFLRTRCDIERLWIFFPATFQNTRFTTSRPFIYEIPTINTWFSAIHSTFGLGIFLALGQFWVTYTINRVVSQSIFLSYFPYWSTLLPKRYNIFVAFFNSHINIVSHSINKVKYDVHRIISKEGKK